MRCKARLVSDRDCRDACFHPAGEGRSETPAENNQDNIYRKGVLFK